MIAYVPVFSPAALLSDPVKVSLPAKLPVVMLYVSAGSLAPYILVWAAAVTVIARWLIVKLPAVFVIV